MASDVLGTYLRYRHDFKTGDVIAFSGKGAFSDAIKWATTIRLKKPSEISHVGTVVLMNLGHSPEKDPALDVMLAESTTMIDLPDAIHKEFVKGLQIHYLSKRIESYPGKIWWYPLLNRMDSQLEQDAIKWMRSRHNARAEYDTVQAMGAAIDFWDFLFENDRDFEKLFCSEFSSEFIRIGGKIPEYTNTSEVLPQELVDFPCFGKPTLLKAEYVKAA